MNRVGVTVAAQTNRLVVGITGGTVAAAYYQVPNVLAVRTGAVLNRIAQVLFPTGAALIARSDYDGLRALYYRSSRLLFLLNGSMTIPIAVFAYPLLYYWVDPRYAQEGALALGFFIITQTVNAAALVVGFLSWSAAKAGTNLVFSLLNSGINLALIYPLASRYGVVGAATAGLLGSVAVPFFIHYVNSRILGVSTWSVVRRCYLPTIAGVIVVAFVSRLMLVPFADSLPSTILLLTLSVALSLGMSGIMGALTRDDCRSVFVTVRSLRSRLVSR
jgi:O-antigen/teichoic acid export membrane protein